MTETAGTELAYAQYAREAAWIAGDVAAAAFARGFQGTDLVDEKQSYADIVTETDKEAERLIAEYLTAAVPDSVFVGEEYGTRGSGDTRWIVDPIDGTSNFASGLPNYSMSIGAYHAGRAVGSAVYDPERDEMFSSDPRGFSLDGRWSALDPAHRLRDATSELLTNLPYEEPGGVVREQLEWFGEWKRAFRAVRSLGSCALHLSYVAAGRVGVCFEAKFNPWDIAAGVQQVAAAGGTVIAWDRHGERVPDPVVDLEPIAALIVHAPGFDLRNSVLAEAMPEQVLATLA